LVTRFAPAPTGHLHLGHVLNAVYVWDIARASGPGSRVLLRIEDHDRTRSRPEFEAALLDDLEWLGFTPDGEMVRQSERGGVYEDAIEGLRRRGLVYACEYSRSELLDERLKPVGNELEHQYEVTYARPRTLIPPKSLEVSVKRPGVTVRARRWPAQTPESRRTRP
jgi:glutamyl/glutaminyl-tRNA synthetase